MTVIIHLGHDQIAEIVAANERLLEDVDTAIAAARRLPRRAFVFFAAFDGTNNDKDELQGDAHSSNVGQLWQQFEPRLARQRNLGGSYYPGLGTKGRSSKETWLGAAVNRGVRRNAERAYDDFRSQASAWRLSHPTGRATVVVGAFSRGTASAAIFSQLLEARGLASPGDVAVGGGVLFDPVATGVEDNLAFAGNVRGLVNLKARNEYRSLFRSVDYAGHADRITTLPMYGNHCDIGGGYDNGQGALALMAAGRYLRGIGLPLSDVPRARRYDPTLVGIHSEAFDNDNRIWDVDHDFTFDDARLSDEDIRVA